MARPVEITRQSLLLALITRGPVSAAELGRVLGVNRASVVRALRRFEEGELLTLGTHRSTRYMLRRPVQNAGNRWPLYLIDEAGTARQWGMLESLYEWRWRVTWETGRPAWADHFCDREGLWQGFPFFLADIRPDGFMGRAIARRLSGILRVPDDPRKWDDDHTLVFLQAAGEDMPGSLVLGDKSLERALEQAVYPAAERMTDSADREIRYPVLAQREAETLPGSSAGGENPKFLTNIRTETGAIQPVLVKFSPPLDQPGGRRWADLLLCEYHALEVLAREGLAVKGAQVLDAGGRRFLEVPRFDRTGAAGRRGVVSLDALHPEAIGANSRTAWPVSVAELHRAGLIESAVASTVHRLHAFGELIGNTDMHAGNLAFWLDDALPFRLAPAYDMVPMLWAPAVQGEIVPRNFAPAPPLPATREAWLEALGWAETFWERVAGDARLSGDFVQPVEAARTALRRLRDYAG
jgi:hypothetical protein